MPTLSTFYGIIIKMYWDEHPPPHFHARYGEFEAQVSIETLEIINGRLPRGATVLIKEWGIAHRDELMEDWKLCEQMKAPKPIMPLE
jgi:hypothetical protein